MAAAEAAALERRAPDVQAAVTILGRWRERLGAPPPVPDLRHADLRGARLGAQLQHASLDRAQLGGASLAAAQLQDTDLDDAELRDAWASEATEWPVGWDADRAKAAGVRFVDRAQDPAPRPPHRTGPPARQRR